MPLKVMEVSETLQLMMGEAGERVQDLNAGIKHRLKH